MNFRAPFLRAAVFALTTALCAPGNLPAMINPGFTPVDLVRQSAAIVRLELAMTDDGKLSATAVEPLRGEFPAQPALGVAADDRPTDRIMREAFGGAGTATALVFTGDFSAAESGDDLATRRNVPAGALIVGTQWFGLFAEPEGGWRIAKDPLELRAVWAGSAAMLERAARYILVDSGAAVPTRVAAEWARAVKAAPPGRALGCIAVDRAQDGRQDLFVLAEDGDRFVSFPDGLIASVTILPSASRLAAWLDLNADGRLDLASWDGEALKLHAAGADGNLSDEPHMVSVHADCRSLHATELGILLGTPSGLALAVANDGGEFAARPVAGPAGVELGPAFPADFDGDGAVDVVQSGAAGLFFYRGTASGALEPAIPACKAPAAGAVAALFAGDFDGDGLLDVIAASGEGPLLFWNTGGGRFRDVTSESGELVYIGKPDVHGGEVCDINNDGRQDVLLTYEAMEPQIFFNRGFRCFGYARPLEPDPDTLTNAASLWDGQRGGAVADFDGDGLQDAAFITSEGEVVVVLQKKTGDPHPGLTVALRGATGPVNVTAWDQDRCLGAQAVWAVRPAFFGKAEPGPLRVEWRFPGKPPQSKEVIVLGADTLAIGE